MVYEKGFAATNVVERPAPGEKAEELGIVALVVEGALLDDSVGYITKHDRRTLAESIETFATDVQNRLPHTKAVILRVAAEETPVEISQALEKLYFEGDDPTTNNHLIGAILIGDIPLPVVHDAQGQSRVSVYPYVDFKEKHFIYNHATDRFESGSDLAPAAEIWHGVLMPPQKGGAGRQLMADFFDKNHQYSIGNPDYSQFDERVLVANFVTELKQFNLLDYRNYLRYGKYLEEMTYQRYNRPLLKQVAMEVGREMNPDVPEDQVKPILDDTSIGFMTDIFSEGPLKKNMTPLADSLKSYLGKLNNLIRASGRWSGETLDSPASLINVRDAFTAQYLKLQNDALEQEINRAIERAATPFNVMSAVDLVVRVKECPTESSPAGECLNVIHASQFPFETYMGGDRIAALRTIDECGLIRGQSRPADATDVLSNNSVLAEANRINNPGTLIIPGEDDEDPIEERQDYREYGGCAGNNLLHPERCQPDLAVRPLFDIKGAREIAAPYPDVERCDARLMNYRPQVVNTPLGRQGQNPFSSEAAVIPGSFPFSLLSFLNTHKSLGQVVDETYMLALARQSVKPIALDPNQEYDDVTLHTKKVSALLSHLAPRSQVITYVPKAGVVVELSTVPRFSALPGTLKHVEPTPKHFREIKRSLATPSLPADGIRFIEFNTSTGKKRFDYPNLFKVEGRSLQEVSDDFLSFVTRKNTELNQLLGREDNSIVRFFQQHTEVIEPIQWQNLSLDQKHAHVLDKYLNQNAFFPTPNGGGAPKQRPVGYEALYLHATQGDATSFRYQVSGSVLGQTSREDKEFDEAKKDTPPPTKKTQGLSAPSGTLVKKGTTEARKVYKCGDPSGVELWEWFDAFQCWVNEELLPAGGLFSLDNSCSGAPIPLEESEELSDVIAFLDPTQADPSGVPARVEVMMARQTLTPGSEERIGIQVMNHKGQVIPSFLEGNVTASFNNPSVGTLSAGTLPLALGQAQVVFKPLQAGEGTLRVSFGSLNQEMVIRVVPALQVKMSAVRNEGGEQGVNSSEGADVDPRLRTNLTTYTVTATLVDGANTPVTNVRVPLQLSTLRYLDGGFQNNGLTTLENGTAQLLFTPNPTRPEIDLVAVNPFFKSTPYRLIQEPNPPDRILIEPKAFVWINDSVRLPVRVVDVNGVTAAGFNGTVDVKVTEATKALGAVEEGRVVIQNGMGQIDLTAYNNTGALHLVASIGADPSILRQAQDVGSQIKPGVLELPVMAGMRSGEMSRLNGNDLFASLLGFPAGDVTTENYFGGVHLFEGKTEAVYSTLSRPQGQPLLTLFPNGNLTVTEARYSIHPQVVNGELLLQVFDDRELKEILNVRRPFRLSSVELWQNGTASRNGVGTLELLHNELKTERVTDGLKVTNREGRALVTVSKSDVILHDPAYRLTAVRDGEEPVFTLDVMSATQRIARLRLPFAPQKLDPRELTVPSPLQLTFAPTGKSTHDFQALQLIDPLAKIESSAEETDDQSGWQNKDKHMLLFAAGNTVGDSVKYSLPLSGILLGDPTIKLEQHRRSNLDYDGTIGQKVYQDEKGATVKAMTSFDFNHDGEMDVAAVFSDGRVRLLEGGPTEPALKDRGDIAFLADGAMALMAFDFKKDGYPELLISTEDGRLAILDNDRGVLTRSNQKIKVGKKIYQLLKADMDANGEEDLISVDSRGDLRIFYGDRGTIPENGVLIGNYGLEVNPNKDLAGDLQVRYAGMGMEGHPIVGADNHPPLRGENRVIKGPIPADLNAALQNTLNPNQTTPVVLDPVRVQQFMEAGKKAAEAEAQGKAPDDPPMLPWPEGDQTETVFARVGARNGVPLRATKTVQNKERPRASDLDLGEILRYTLTLNPTQPLKGAVLADTVPDALNVDRNSVQCTPACPEAKIQSNGTLLFIGNLNLKANQDVTITYEAKVIHTPKANVLLKRLSSPNDAYVDLIVSPPFNNTGQVVEHYTTAPRTYGVRATPPPRREDNPLAKQAEVMATLQSKVLMLDTTNPDPGAIQEILDASDIGTLQQGLESDVDTSQCSEEDLVCAERAVDRWLDGAIGKVNDFACMGSACFPFPVNYPLFVPPGPAIPAFAFPTTLPTPFGPFPFFWSLLGGSPIGAADIPGPIMSMIRLYLSPTLTGGVGVAFCWGPYLGRAVPPPPLWPIPYPPPIGNCMVNALPQSALPWGRVCKDIERGITAAIQAANSVVNDLNSGVAAVNNNSYFGDQGGESAGGLEVNLAIQLGNKTKFVPPVKAFSNIHIPSFDAIFGVLASWWDRQKNEILNKVLTLPNIRVALPNVVTLMTGEWDEFKEQLDTFTNVVQGSAQGEVRTAQEVWADSGLTDKQKAEQGTLDKINDIGSRVNTAWEGLDDAMTAYSPDIIQNLYDLVNAFPLVQITEHPVDIKVPWISPQQLQAALIDYRNWADQMKQELDRATNVWAKFNCPAADERSNVNTASWEDFTENLAEKYGNDWEQIKDGCQLRQVADLFVVDLKGTIESVNKNIEVLQSYMMFPRKVIKFKAQLFDYLRQFGCDLTVLADLLGGWQARVREQLIGYAEFGLTLKEIVKNITDIFDIFINFESNCDLCTNERFHWFGWITLLGLIIPDIPIIKFPKWPDVFIDLSDLKVALKVDLPRVNFVAEPIILPRLPTLRLPDIPDLKMFLTLPKLPILPALPELPDLPPLPPIPTIKLPTLPPPPKIPDIGKTFGAVVPLVEKILQLWCLIRKSLTPIPESMLGDQISLLTTRPAYLIPLDLLKISFPDIAVFDLGFNEVQVNVKMELGVRFKATYETFQKTADEWNKSVTDIAGALDKLVKKEINSRINKLQNTLDEGGRFLNEKFADLEKMVNEAGNFEKVQKVLDDIQKQSDKMTRDMQTFSDEVQEKMNEGVQEATTIDLKKLNNPFKKANQDAMDGLNEFNKNIREGVRDVKDTLREGDKTIDDALDLRPNDVPGGPQSFVPLQQMAALASELTRVVENNNNPEWVDYRVIKERLGVPDVHFAPRPTQADQIQRMRRSILAYADDLQAEISNGTDGDDLRVLAQNKAPRLDNPYVLAAAENSPETINPVMTSAVPGPFRSLDSAPSKFNPPNPPYSPRYKGIYSGEQEGNLPSARDNTVMNIPSVFAENNIDNGAGQACVGSCISDPITNQMVTFVSYADNFGTMQTIFVPTKTPNKTNVVYSDDNSIYLKRNLTIPPDTRSNQPSTFFGPKIRNLRDFVPQGEALDLMKIHLQGNQASTFEWKESTNPKRYGTLLELEKTVTGFDSDEQDNGTSDLKIILLPPDGNGEAPEVLVNGKPIDYGTLLVAEDDATTAFPLKPARVITGVKTVEFSTLHNIIRMQPGRAIYLDEYTSSSYELKAANGFYHLKASWFDREGNFSTVNANEVLAPQIYGERSLPLTVLAQDKFLVPIFKRQVIRASTVFTDLTGAYQYSWDTNQDGLPDVFGPEFVIPPQSEPREFRVDLAASLDFTDPLFEVTKRPIRVTVYVPKINLEDDPLQDNGEVKGTLVPREASHDLSDIPFGIFRQRWGVWKNLGRPTTIPPEDATRSYRTATNQGDYLIKGLNTTDRRVVVRDQNEQDLAYVLPGTGQIDLVDSEHYFLKPLFADETHATRIGIFETATNHLNSNVYYVADGNTDVVIRSEGLSASNVYPIGVTVGDRNESDRVTAKVIPGFAPSFPGGAAMVAEGKNIVLIRSDGAIRLMRPGYHLILKNPGALTERPIFVITDPFDQPLFDVFIAADFSKPMIKQGETWDDTGARIGMAGTDPINRFRTGATRLFTEDAHAAETDRRGFGSAPTAVTPFSDVKPDHPQFKAIKDLYDLRVISGYGDGTFRPDAQISRAEFVKIALGATNCLDCSKPTEPQRTKYSPFAPFPDVVLSAWYYFCIWMAKELRMVTGYGDGFFRPEQNISRAEAVAVLLRQSGIDLVKTPNQEFIDVPAYAWYKDYVYTAVQLGLVKNNLGFVFPDQEITRAEFAFMADLVMNLKDCREVDSDKDGMPDRWEMAHQLDPLFAGDAGSDADHDNLTALEEFQRGTDTTNADSDGDSLRDDLDPQPAPVPSVPVPGSRGDSPGETGRSGRGQEEDGQRGADRTGVDGARTVVSEDVDSDGVKNTLELFGEDGLIREGANAASEDNCIFVVNPDQADSDGNGVGDLCEEHDLCPTLPEDADGVDDTDGCPEVTDLLPTTPPGTYVNHGPFCYFLDYMADLVPGDTLFTAITDLATHTTVFSRSQEVKMK